MSASIVALSSSSIASGAASLTASAPGVTPTTITIGYMSALSGIASSTFADGPGGVMARIDEQNALGGVDGRKIKLVIKDDASNLTTDATDAEELGASTFGIIDFSPFTFSGAPALQKTGVPVTGLEVDGPEWGQEPYNNMFSYGPPASTPYNGTFYTYAGAGNFLKSIGVTKLANLSYSISPSAIQASKDTEAAAALSGVNANCYTDFNVAFGATDFTADALAIKQNGCNGVESPMVDSSDVAIASALKNAGLSNVKQLYFTGYSQDVISNPAANAVFQGAYVSTGINFVTPNPGVQAMLNAFRKYIPGYKGGIPDLGLYGSYLGADLMIKGLELAGRNPTRQSFISNLRKLTNYTANGILATPTSYPHLGTKAMLPQVSCGYVVQLKGKKFVVANGGKKLCGKLIAVRAS